MKYYIDETNYFGIEGDIAAALAHPNAPTDDRNQFKRVTEQEYNDSVLDFRFEGDEWVQ